MWIDATAPALKRSQLFAAWATTGDVPYAKTWIARLRIFWLLLDRQRFRRGMGAAFAQGIDDCGLPLSGALDGVEVT